LAASQSIATFGSSVWMMVARGRPEPMSRAAGGLHRQFVAAAAGEETARLLTMA